MNRPNRRPASVLALLVVGAAVSAEAQTTVVLRDGVSPTPSYSGTRDLQLVETALAPDANYDGAQLSVDGYPIASTVLMRFDLSMIPPGSVPDTVELVFRVTDNSTDAFPIYECLRSWSETQATADVAAPGAPWAGFAASGVGTDRGVEVLASLLAPVTGFTPMRFTDAGVTAVTRWIAQPQSNFGFTLQDFAAGNGLDWSDCQTGTVANRPRLRLGWPDGGTLELQNGLSGYSGCADTLLWVTPPTGGNANGFRLASGVADHGRMVTLVSFDVSSIPRGARVTAAVLELFVGDGSSAMHPIYEVIRPWTETGATWTTSDGVTAWGMPGAQGPSDRGPQIGVARPGPRGLTDYPLDDAGVELVQAWISGAKSNHGLMISNITTTSELALADREEQTPAQRPGLRVTYDYDGGAGGGAGGSAGTDGGTTAPKALQVGCACSSTGPAVALLLLFAVARAVTRRRVSARSS